MTVAYGSKAGATLANLGSASLVINKPTGTASGDFLVCFIVISANATITPPTGWTTEVNAAGVKCYARLCDGTEGASFTFTRGTTTNNIVGNIVRFTSTLGFPANPIDAIGAQSGGSSTSVILPTITPVAGTYLWQMGSMLANVFWTPPGTATEDYDASPGPQAYGSFGGHETVSLGVATGTRTWATSPSTSNTRSGVQMTLKENSATSVDADPAALTLVGETPDLAGSGAAATTADTGTLTLVGETPPLAGSGAASVAADAGTVALTGVDTPIAGTGAASLVADVAALTLAGETPTFAGSGASSVTADTAAVVLTAETPTLSGSGAVSLTVDPAVLSLLGIDVSTAGSILVAADPAVLTLAGITPDLAGSGEVTTAADTAAVIFTGVTPDLTPGAAELAAEPAVLLLTGVTPDIAGGASNVTIDPAILTLIGGEVVASLPDPNPVTITVRAAGSRATASGVLSRATIRPHNTRATVRER